METLLAFCVDWLWKFPLECQTLPESNCNAVHDYFARFRWTISYSRTQLRHIHPTLVPCMMRRRRQVLDLRQQLD